MSINTKYFVCLTLLCGIGAQYTDSPCPNVFQYQYDQRFGLHGLIQVVDPDTKVLQLNIELSVGNIVSGNNGYIELVSTSKQQVIDDVMNNRPVRYKVIFPAWQNIPPKITKILANGRLICSGPKLTISQVPVVTTINLQHTLRIDVQPLSFNGNRPNYNNNFNSDDSKNNIFYENQLPPDNANGNFFDNRKDNRYRPFMYGQNSNNNNNKHHNNNNNPIMDYRPIFEMYGIKNPHNFNPVPPVGGTPILDFITYRPDMPNNSNNNNNNNNNINNNNNNNNNMYSQNPFLNGQNSAEKYGNRGTPSPEQSQVRPNIGPSDAAPRPSFPIAMGTGATRYDNICGQSLHTNTLIVNGDSVMKGAYPWLVALYKINQLGPTYTCCGSLISDRHVITAAHCVFSGEKKLRPRELLVKLGRLNLQDWTESREGQTVQAESIHVHPDYMSLNSDADLAMIVLNDPVSFTNLIRPLCLWKGDNFLENIIGNEGTVVGWGRDEDGHPVTVEAKQTRLPIVSQEQCLRSSQQYIYLTSNRTFCAGFRNGSGPCNGDSGSGFIMQSGGRWMLRGVVSMSLSTYSRSCDLKNYVVFTDASKFMTWITSFLK